MIYLHVNNRLNKDSSEQETANDNESTFDAEYNENDTEVKIHCKISREKFEPDPGFKPRTSGFLVRRSTT